MASLSCIEMSCLCGAPYLCEVGCLGFRVHDVNDLRAVMLARETWNRATELRFKEENTAW